MLTPLVLVFSCALSAPIADDAAYDLPLRPAVPEMPLQIVAEAEQVELSGGDELLLAPMASCEDPSCFDDCTDVVECELWCPTWEASFNALLLTRNNPSKRILHAFAGPTPTDVVFDSSDMDFGPSLGAGVSIERHAPCGGVEAEYFFLESDERTTFDPGANVVGPSFRTADVTSNVILDIGLAAPWRMDYGASLRSTEFNLQRELCGGFTIEAGARWIHLQEEFTLHNDTGPVDYRAKVTNNLWGFQLGAEWDRPYIWNCISLEAELNAGIYYNLARRDSDFGATIALPVNNVGARDEHAAFVGEIALGGRYEITDRVAIQAGYQLMWIEGVSLAAHTGPIPAAGPGGTAVDITDGVLYHGGFVGLSIRR